MTEVSADVSEVMAQLSTSIHKAREDMGLLQQMTTDLRDEIARTRMVPIGSLFTRFQKAVREMARTVGKDVEVVFSGARTEVDAGVVQRLAEPLIHMMRNAVAHGDRKSTRLNSSHSQISYAVFCLKKKKKTPNAIYQFMIPRYVDLISVCLCM